MFHLFNKMMLIMRGFFHGGRSSSGGGGGSTLGSGGINSRWSISSAKNTNQILAAVATVFVIVLVYLCRYIHKHKGREISRHNACKDDAGTVF